MRRGHEFAGRTLRPQGEGVSHVDAEALARLLLVRPASCVSLQEPERLEGLGSISWGAFRTAEAEAGDPVALLRYAFSEITGVEAVLVFGSIANGSDGPDSAIDVFVFGDRCSDQIYRNHTTEVGLILDHEVNTLRYSREMLLERARHRRHPAYPFVRRVLGSPKAWVVGSDQRLASILREVSRQIS